MSRCGWCHDDWVAAGRPTKDGTGTVCPCCSEPRPHTMGGTAYKPSSAPKTPKRKPGKRPGRKPRKKA